MGLPTVAVAQPLVQCESTNERVDAISAARDEIRHCLAVQEVRWRHGITCRISAATADCAPGFWVLPGKVEDHYRKRIREAELPCASRGNRKRMH
jgi:hypothetical protein